MSDRLAVLPQYLLPKQALTQLAGAFASARLGGLTTWAIKRFIARYGVDWYLDRAHASPLIEALLALPNAKRKRAPTKRKRAASGAAEKLSWSGTVLAVRPRIKSVLLGGEAKHSYQGYVLVLEGTLGEVARTFAVGLGKAAQGKHGFRAGDRASGAGVAIDDPAGHACDLHKASKLAREPGPEPAPGGPPAAP